MYAYVDPESRINSNSKSQEFESITQSQSSSRKERAAGYRFPNLNDLEEFLLSYRRIQIQAYVPHRHNCDTQPPSSVVSSPLTMDTAAASSVVVTNRTRTRHPTPNKRRKHSNDTREDVAEEAEKLDADPATVRPKKRINRASVTVATESNIHHTITSSHIASPHTDTDETMDESMIHEMNESDERTITKSETAPAAASKGSQQTTIRPMTRGATSTTRSPMQRCDQHSLSIIFSFLKNKEFSSAILVNHAWYSTAQLNTSWPPFNIEAFIHQLQNENYSGSGQRQLVLACVREISRASNHPIMKKVNHIILRECTPKRSLIKLTEFPFLTALNITVPNNIKTDHFTKMMKDRLHVLILSSHWTCWNVFPTLHDLSALRVLVTDFPIPADQLEGLRQLEFLHVSHAYFMTTHYIRCLRLLSVYDRLRHASIEWTREDRPYYGHMKLPSDEFSEPIHQSVSHFPDQEGVFDIDRPELKGLKQLTHEWRPPPTGQPFPPARLTYFGITRISLRPHHFAYVLSLPHLTRLQCQVSDRVEEGGIFSEGYPLDLINDVTTGLSALSELQLCIAISGHVIKLPGLTYCTSLTSLQLSGDTSSWMQGFDGSACQLILDPKNWTELEELSVAYPLALTHESIQALSTCKHLHRLDLSNRPIIDLDRVAPMLSKLPEFQILELTVWPPESKSEIVAAASPFVIPATFMQHVSLSSTWTSLHLHLKDELFSRRKNSWSIESIQRSLRRGGLVDSVTSNRFRLQVHSSHDEFAIYRVMIDHTTGKQVWSEL